MKELGLEAIISIALTVFSIIVTFVSYYFYIRGKLHKAAAGAITNAEQDDKTGEEKLELAVEQVYSLIPISLKPFIHKKSVRKIVQAAFDKIEDYAQKQVEKAKKKDVSGGSDSKEQNEQNAESVEISPSDEITDSGGQAESPPDNEG